MIKALIFDFDGLIVDTEGPEYQSWQEIYESFGCSLPLSVWANIIGASSGFDPYEYLARQLGHPVDRVAIRARRRPRFAELMEQQTLLPGVDGYILEAKQLGLKVGLASSSLRSWVMGYLTRFGLAGSFDCMKCADDVEHTKPDPALYYAALRALDVQADEAIALEDSPNGVLAATRAGIYCVAVPNLLTRQLVFDEAILQIASLAEVPLGELLAQINSTKMTQIAL